MEGASNQVFVENRNDRYDFSPRLFCPTERPFKALAVGSSPTELTKPQHFVVFQHPHHNLLIGTTPCQALVEAKALVEPTFLTLLGYFLGTFGLLTP